MTQSPTPTKTLSHYQDLLHKAKAGATITVPQEHVTLVSRMAHRLYIEKSLKIKAAANAAAKSEAP